MVMQIRTCNLLNCKTATETQGRKDTKMSLSWAESCSIWANWALVCALAVGVIATFLIVVSGKVKEDALKRELAAASERIAEASVRIEETTARAAEANARAAEANKIAEEERHARVRIEQRLAPRSLSGEQQKNIAEKLRQFATQSFEFLSYQDDQEVRGLVLMIAQSLLAAAWQGVKPTSFLAFDLIIGVIIEYPTNESKAAATALANALLGEGITASASLNQKYTEHTERIRIRVGKKP